MPKNEPQICFFTIGFTTKLISCSTLQLALWSLFTDFKKKGGLDCYFWLVFERKRRLLRRPYTCSGNKWNLTTSIWQVALVKLTCHPRLRPPFKSLDKWQLVKSTCQVTPLKLHAQAVRRTLPRGTGGGCQVTVMVQKKGSKYITFKSFGRFLFSENLMFLKQFCDVFHNERPYTNRRASCVAAKHQNTHIYIYIYLLRLHAPLALRLAAAMGWLRLVGSLKV